MVNYITWADVGSFVGSSCNSNISGMLAEMASSFFDRLIWSEGGLLLSERTDYFVESDFACWKVGKIFYLKNFHPTTITSINWNTTLVANTDYILDGRRLEMKNPVSIPGDFPNRIAVVYEAWLEKVPYDVKTSCLFLAKWLHNQRKNADMASFKQDLLSVNFTTGKSFLDTLCDPSDSGFINLIVNKYRITYFHAI